MSAEGAKDMQKAASEISIFGSGKKKDNRPTKDHLAPEDGSSPPQQAPSADGVAAGSFEKLSGLFSGGLLGRRD